MNLPMSGRQKNHFEIGFFESVLRRNPRDTGVIEILGSLYTEAGRIEDGLRMDRRMVRLLPENAVAHYNLACSLALKKRPADAMKSLRKAVDLGYKEIEWIVSDPDLEELQQRGDFRDLIASLAGDG